MAFFLGDACIRGCAAEPEDAELEPGALPWGGLGAGFPLLFLFFLLRCFFRLLFAFFPLGGAVDGLALADDEGAAVLGFGLVGSTMR